MKMAGMGKGACAGEAQLELDSDRSAGDPRPPAWSGWRTLWKKKPGRKACPARWWLISRNWPSPQIRPGIGPTFSPTMPTADWPGRRSAACGSRAAGGGRSGAHPERPPRALRSPWPSPRPGASAHDPELGRAVADENCFGPAVVLDERIDGGCCQTYGLTPYFCIISTICWSSAISDVRSCKLQEKSTTCP